MPLCCNLSINIFFEFEQREREQNLRATGQQQVLKRVAEPETLKELSQVHKKIKWSTPVSILKFKHILPLNNFYGFDFEICKYRLPFVRKRV